MGILKTAVYGLSAVSLAAILCHAQVYNFNSVTAGLGNLDVNCIAQDHAGYIWVGTENGLYRYDGRSFSAFGPADGLSSHVIQSLFAAPDGTLFVGTTTGIYFLRHDGAFSQIHPPPPATGFSQRIGSVFTAIAPDQVATADRSGAFLLRRTAEDTWIAEPMYLEGQTIWSMLATPNGVLWYGCDSEVCRRENGKTTHVRGVLHLPEDRWLHMTLDRDGHLWIRGATHLGEVIDGENRYEPHDLPGRSNSVPYAALASDADGQVVASQGPDLGLWENGTWRLITARNGLSRYDISDVYVDREGSLWIGVVGHGLVRWVGQDRWEAYTVDSGLSNDIVWSTLRDQGGRLWIGTESGLDYLPAGSNTPKVWQSPGVQTDRAASFAESADGSVWVGSAAGNLTRIDPHTLAGKQWKIPEVFRVLSDGDHRIWAATSGGLFVVDTSARDVSPQVEEAGIAHPRERFTDLTLDADHTLWAASDEGIYRRDGTGWHAIDAGLSAVIPMEIAADKNGILWAAGAFPGLMRLHVVKDRVVESEHVSRPHLLSDQVVSLELDHRGWLWVGQDAGLAVYDGQSWRSFTQDDGLIWNDTDSYAISEDRDGTMWIGTSAGLSHLLKPQAVPAAVPAAPVFSSIKFGNATIQNESEIPWSANPLTITVSALSYRDASHIRIRYRLLGVESEWVESSDRNIRYARLEPGPYRFQAIVVDDTGATTSAAESGTAGETVSPVEEVSFVITPQWWQSSPLRLAFVLGLALCVVMAWRWSVHLLVRQKRILEKAVQHRTEDLETEKAELLRAREQMRHFAEHDDLTGLWNHRIIVERLRQEVDRSRREKTPLSVILVDLDHFKNVNDTCGHPAGDLVLKEVAAIFQSSVRSYDWVGRYGGEEFLLILPGSGFAGARVRAEQLRMAVQWARIHDGTRSIPMTASFGVASGFPSHFEMLIQAADVALYRAKNSGRNCVMAAEIEPEVAPESES
jgi:diguanylate cyclase (GGDEF)-like protein